MVVGGDIAAARNDASVLPFRRRLDARSFDPVKLRGLDLMCATVPPEGVAGRRS